MAPGLSRGIVNFHFESKEKLLVATLQHMADEYSAHWRATLLKAGDDPAQQLCALVMAISIARSATSASSRPGAPSGARRSRARPIRRCAAPMTRAYQTVFIDLCRKLKDDGGYSFRPLFDGARPQCHAGGPLAAPDDGHRGCDPRNRPAGRRRVSGFGFSAPLSAAG